jgi:hypothetical protein
MPVNAGKPGPQKGAAGSWGRVRRTKTTKEHNATRKTYFFNSIGHSRPMHSVPVPINVRCNSNSDIIVRRREVTLRANLRQSALQQ